ncbi:quercetin 2,3-dioxygenase [Oceaniferula spumae]|uniref:Quercetin 2,3-dioxygenase n=1 Tax=Oceaniferula spumae TaxID=2979115 RepID=A0AAT9FSB7_9BACT
MKTDNPTKISILRADERGHAGHGWLDSWHTFSFADYYDPAHMGYHSLRVINEDTIAPGKGFGMHPHSSMEIFTYIISGQLEHEDSMGNGRVIKAGEFQYMSAGEGVMHSELNPSVSEPVHLLQIWITPNQDGGSPRYADMDTNAIKQNNALTLFASGDGKNGSFEMRQHAEIYFGQLETGATLTQDCNDQLPHMWLQMIKGELELDGNILHAGDAVALENSQLALQAKSDSEFLLFQLG